MYRSLAAMKACLVITVLAVSAGVALSNGPEEEIAFPYLLKIAPGNMLVVHGHVFTGEVWLTYAPGDSLRVEGLPIYPLPPVPRKVLSEEGLAKTYGRVDYVRDLVDSGYTWRQATDAYVRKVNEATGNALKLYRSVLDSTGDSQRAAAAVVDSFDRSLLEPGTKPRVTASAIIVDWQGSVPEVISLKPLGNAEPQQPSLPLPLPKTEEEIAESKARVLIRSLSGGRIFILKSPRGTRILGGDPAIRAMEQIEEAKRGSITEGPVDETELRRVIEVQGDNRR